MYDEPFFDAIGPGSLGSARAVVPIVLALSPARSVLDVGCGRGEWLSVFREQGVPEIRGLDGGYVDPAKLCINPDSFTAVDLYGSPGGTGRTSSFTAIHWLKTV